jgi:hypothetical protein
MSHRPSNQPRPNLFALIFAFAWAAIATVAAGLLLVLFVVARNDNILVLTALGQTSVAGEAQVAQLGGSATAFVLTASVTDTPTATPPPTHTPTHNRTPTATPPVTHTPEATALPGDVAGLVETGVAQTLTAIAPALFVPTNTPQPTIPRPAQPSPPEAPAVPLTLTNFVCRAALGDPNVYQILGTVTNVSGTAYFVEFMAQADMGDSRNLPMGPGAQWIIPEGSPNPEELIYVQFLPDGTNYLRIVARVTECPGGNCTGVAGSAESPSFVLIEGSRDQLCP